MSLVYYTLEESLALKQKRIGFILETTRGYTSLEDYARDMDEWVATPFLL